MMSLQRYVRYQSHVMPMSKNALVTLYPLCGRQGKGIQASLSSKPLEFEGIKIGGEIMGSVLVIILSISELLQMKRLLVLTVVGLRHRAYRTDVARPICIYP